MGLFRKSKKPVRKVGISCRIIFAPNSITISVGGLFYVANGAVARGLGIGAVYCGVCLCLAVLMFTVRVEFPRGMVYEMPLLWGEK